MVILRATPYEHFAQEIGSQHIICFGAGNTFDYLLKSCSDELQLFSKIAVILDNSVALDGTLREIYERQIPVKTIQHFLSEDPVMSDYVILLCNNKSINEIIEQLDHIEHFNGVSCFIWNVLLEENGPCFSSTIAALPYHYKDYQIPRKIHYCWFGGKEMPARDRANLESWKKYCPDYEIILWNEKNYDIEKNKYMKDAYLAKKWGFVPDFARFDIIYEHGGFYLDTDVELVRGLDPFTKFKAFLAFEFYNLINPGSGFGSIPKNPLIKELIGIYKDKDFIFADNTLNLVPSPVYTTEFFRNRGVEINNRMQIVEDTVFFPSDFLCPLNQKTALYELTINTHAIHKFFCSWFNDEQLKEWEEAKQNTAVMNERLMHDFINKFLSTNKEIR